MKKAGLIIGILGASSLLSGTALAVGMGNTTPSVWNVTLDDVYFCHDGTDCQLYSDDSHTYDIASASAGNNVGFFGAGSTVPAGDYNQIRFDVNATMGIKAVNTSLNCHTVTDGGTFSKGLVLIGASKGEEGSDAGDAELQDMTMPTGTNMNYQEDSSLEGGEFQVTMTIPEFHLDNTAPPPEMKMKFDLTNSISFTNDYSGSPDNTPCVVYPEGPSVCVQNVATGEEVCDEGEGLFAHRIPVPAPKKH